MRSAQGAGPATRGRPWSRSALQLVAGAMAACAATGALAADSPGKRFGHELVHDAARGTLLLYGGFDEGGAPLSDTWTYGGEGWRALETEGPPARRWPAAAYDSRRGRIVLFGGRAGTGRSGLSLADTWIWNGAIWTRLDIPGPPARDHHRMVYDEARDRVVLFGGWDGSFDRGDTWEFDGEAWTRIDVAGPSPRSAYGLAYDAAAKRVVLHGGKTAANEHFGDAWAWDGEAWTHLVAQAPSPRAFHAMAFDGARNEIVLVGGRDADVHFTDVWTLKNGEWSLAGKDGPKDRGVYALAPYAGRKSVVFHGGGVFEGGSWRLNAETWEWKGSRWNALP